MCACPRFDSYYLQYATQFLWKEIWLSPLSFLKYVSYCLIFLHFIGFSLSFRDEYIILEDGVAATAVIGRIYQVDYNNVAIATVAEKAAITAATVDDNDAVVGAADVEAASDMHEFSA